MIDKVFQIIGKRSVTPDGEIQYPVQDQLTGAFLTMSMGVEDSDFLVPGAFLCHDSGSGNNLLYPVGSLAKIAEHYGFKDVALRFGQILKVYPVKGSTSIRINVRYIGNSNELMTSSVPLHPGAKTGGSRAKKGLAMVDGRVVVLALSASDLADPLGAWLLEGDR
jgi:hypothetical protein